MANSKHSVKRRYVIGAVLVLIAAAPLARIALLRLKDNLLPPVAEPRVAYVDGWLLDASDLADGDRE